MVVHKVKKIIKRGISRLKTGQTKEDYQVGEALEYIDNYWPTLEREAPKGKGTLIKLPNKYIIPSTGHEDFAFEEQYYWDSYFISLGLEGPEHQEIVEGMLENMFVLYKRFSLIPNASRTYFTSRSQPPLLTTYIFMVYDRYEKSNEWLKERMEIAKDEYHTVWMGERHPHWRNVFHGLSRYYDVNVLHDLAEAESGWDMTPRFSRNCLDYLPIDLNALLYQYETDFARTASILGDEKEAHHWRVQADKRKKAVDKYMWSKKRGFYFDYDYINKSRGSVWSLAGYYAMWAGMASEEQASHLVDNLSKFDKTGGLSTTSRSILDVNNLFGSLKTQWAYPNGWAPLHYIVVAGLERYGYHEEAEKIARKWVKTNLKWFNKHDEFLEKYNVVNPTKPPEAGVYPSQRGFGWTNGVFVVFAKKYFHKEH